ncbi:MULTISPECIES: hypothetical protein, partial [unclassified Ensifer]|uniref:hypothetical protein n=1 Tax=unclassified Ensifer TaxID=2633371 RepID=UPI00300FC046
SKHLEASRHIFSSQCNQNRHQAKKPMQTLFLQGYLNPNHQPQTKRSFARPKAVAGRPASQSKPKWWS